MLVAVPGLMLSCGVLLKEVRSTLVRDARGDPRSEGSQAAAGSIEAEPENGAAITIDAANANMSSNDVVRIGWTAVFFFGVVLFGFRLAPPVVVGLYSWRAGEPPILAVVMGAVAYLLMQGFGALFGLRFPPGVLMG
ncbi:MAG: hypothetical protein GEU78_20025 [Actinobacteria bacterium]|nr:hypothetical protein [Actinomycetota bacterium]